MNKHKRQVCPGCGKPLQPFLACRYCKLTRAQMWAIDKVRMRLLYETARQMVANGEYRVVHESTPPPGAPHMIGPVIIKCSQCGHGYIACHDEKKALAAKLAAAEAERDEARDKKAHPEKETPCEGSGSTSSSSSAVASSVASSASSSPPASSSSSTPAAEGPYRVMTRPATGQWYVERAGWTSPDFDLEYKALHLAHELNRLARSDARVRELKAALTHIAGCGVCPKCLSTARQALASLGGEETGRVTDITHAMADQAAELRADLEICMEALDKLAYRNTFGAALFSNICEAGRNELDARIEFADRERKRTSQWQHAAAELDKDNGTCPDCTCVMCGRVLDRSTNSKDGPAICSVCDGHKGDDGPDDLAKRFSDSMVLVGNAGTWIKLCSHDPINRRDYTFGLQYADGRRFSDYDISEIRLGLSNAIKAAYAAGLARSDARMKELKAALEWYANPEVYKSNPHGPAFDRPGDRHLSFKARQALSGEGRAGQ